MFGKKSRALVITAIAVASIFGSGAEASLRPQTPPEFTDVSVSLFHTCALRSDGKMFCWGDDVYGQLGDNDNSAKSFPVPVGEPIASKTVVAMDTGGYSTCAVTSEGELYCWGANGAYGNLGIGTTDPVSGPTLVNGGAPAGKPVVDASPEQFYGCALTDDALVACWGYNGHGQVGDGTTTNRLSPVLVSGGDVLGQDLVAVHVGDRSSCAITQTRQLMCWGHDVRSNDSTVFKKVPRLIVSGYLRSKIVSSVAGYSHLCALTDTMRLACWGSNTYGELGNGTTTPLVKPTVVNSGALRDKNVIQATAGELGHTCVIRRVQANDYGKVVCWGVNSSGQLGDGTAVNALSPKLINSGALRQKNVRVISAGMYNTCAITVSNQILCWGDNAYGQIGDGTTTDRLSARAVTWVE